MPKKKRIISPISILLKPEIKDLIKEEDWNTLKEVLPEWEPVDIAELIRELEDKERLILFRLLPPKLQSEVFAEFDSKMQKYILKNLTNEYIKSIITGLDPDDRTRLFEELPPEVTRKLLNLLSPEDRKESLQLLGYPEDSVGRLMTPDYIAVKPSWSIKEAIQHIRNKGKDAETINMIYVVDDEWHLIDDIPIRRLILSKSNQSIESIMDYHFVSINAMVDQEEAIKLIQKYNLYSLPVTDSKGHLLGIVTHDDIIDVLREEETEDFTKLSAIEAKSIGMEFITRIKEVPLAKMFKVRIVWLLALLIMDLIVGGIIKGFEGMIAKYVVLVTFLPVLIDTAGNAGSQSATLVIRALALGTVKIKDWIYLLGRELLIAGALGVAMGFGISIMGFLRGGGGTIVKVIVLAMITNVVVGSLIGVSLPFIFTKFRKDPATASTPLITTLADIFGTGIYLGIAHLILG
ncbi:MAG: magnesium transporter [candidate division WOR-3 bacterium]